MDQLVLCGTDPAAWTVLQFPRAAKTREHNSALKSTTDLEAIFIVPRCDVLMCNGLDKYLKHLHL